MNRRGGALRARVAAAQARAAGDPARLTGRLLAALPEQSGGSGLSLPVRAAIGVPLECCLGLRTIGGRGAGQPVEHSVTDGP